VFIHGLGATSNAWHAQRVTLSKYFRVIAYDRSGCGRSAKSRDGYSIDGWADELAALSTIWESRRRSSSGTRSGA
jgi:3-oxoadipate enol-lactonase